MKKQILAQILTYSGTLPFLSCAICSAVGIDILGLNLERILILYGAVIASFIAGIHWGVYLFKESAQNLFIHSNIVALLAWFAAIPMIPGIGGILMICFFYLIFIDKQLTTENVLEAWYLRMRIIATIIVLLALGLHVLF